MESGEGEPALSLAVGGCFGALQAVQAQNSRVTIGVCRYVTG